MLPLRGGGASSRAEKGIAVDAPGPIRRLAADRGYDADWLRADLRSQGITPVIPGTRARKRKIRHDRRRYRERWRIEAMFALAAVIAFWC